MKNPLKRTRPKNRNKPKPIRTAIAKGTMKIPGVRKLYVKSMLKALDSTPPNRLPPDLRQLQAALKNVPKAQRLAFVQAAMKGELPKPSELSRDQRRTVERQQRKGPPGTRQGHRPKPKPGSKKRK